MIGESANAGEPANWEVEQGRVGRGGRTLPRSWDPGFPVRGFEFYDGRVGVERTTFVNFQPYTAGDGSRREESGLGYRIDNDFSIHPRNFASGLRFVNAKPVFLETPEVGHDGDVSAAFLDADGSVTGTAGRTVTTRNPFLYGTACEGRDDWNAQLCSGDYATLIVGAPGTPAAVKPVTLTRPDGQVQTLQANTDDAADSANSTILANSTYRVGFAGGTPAHTRFVLAHGENRTVTIALPRAAGFRVTHWDCDMSAPRQWCFGAATSLAALQAMTKAGYWYDDAGDADPVTGTLYLRIVAGADSTYDELEVQ
jgi:cell migration-inducing and hyaluronan-binding protein